MVEEKVTPSTASVRIAKTTIIHSGAEMWVRAKISGKRADIFMTDISMEGLEIGSTVQDQQNIVIPVINTSEKMITLKKGETFGQAMAVQQTKVEVVDVSMVDLARSDYVTINNDVFMEYDKILMEVTKKCLPIQHTIQLTNDIPVSVPERRIPYVYREEIDREIVSYCEKGYITESISPYNAPIVPVVKPNGKIRVCLDYRALNAISVPGSFPIRRKEDLFEAAKGSKYFSVLDLSNAYFHISVKEEDCEKTAFSHEGRKFQWKKLPFGLQGGAFSLTANLAKILNEYSFANAYYDDILIFSETQSEHETHLKTILKCLAEHDLKINKAKCQIMQKEVTFLGHRLSAEGLKPSKGKLGEIVEFPVPKRLEELKTFLGMAAFFRKFVPNYSHLASTLHALDKKNVSFVWTDACQHSFELIKSALSDENILSFPEFDKPFIVHSDASLTAIGFMLAQEREGELVPIMFGGRSLNKSEQNYSPLDRELLACFYAVSQCKIYLLCH